MYPRTEYEMTEEDLSELLNSLKYLPRTSLRKLGEKMGFDSATVKPIVGKGFRFFTAVPSETEAQREERLKMEADEKRLAEIDAVKAQIQELETKLEQLRRRR